MNLVQVQNFRYNTNTETGNDTSPQLYNLNSDIGEKINVAQHNPDLVKELADLLEKDKR